MPSSRLLSFLARPFAPPFHGLGVFVWMFFVWAHLIHSETGFWHGVFPDSDDIVHLLRTVDWLQGQDWFDPVLHRLAPPEGVAIHYSRLYELPLAGILWPLKKMGLSWVEASYAASLIWPFLLLSFLFPVLRWAVAPFVPSGWAGFSAFVALFTVPLMLQFSPGRVDHHGFSAILVALALGFVVRFMESPQKPAWALGAGFCLAFGQAVALETLPWLLLFSGWIGLWVVIKGRVWAVPAMVFGTSLYLFSFLFLAASVPFDSWYALNLLAYSYLYVLIAGGIALGLFAVGLASFWQSAWPRVAVSCGALLLFSGGMLYFFPEFAKGPYGGVDPAFAQNILAFINEAIPLILTTNGAWSELSAALFPLFGLWAAYLLLVTAKREDVPKWAFLFLLILVALGAALLYQKRVLLYAGLFSIFSLTALVPAGLKWARTRYKGRRLFSFEIAVLLLAGPLAGLFLPALADGRSFNTGVGLFPVVAVGKETCFTSGVRYLLNAPGYYGDKPRLIMSGINEGARILFHSPHRALGAPYHMNVKGNVDSLRFLQAMTADQAADVLKETGAELVLLCEPLTDLYTNTEKTLRVGPDGKTISSDGEAFAEQLVAGKVPEWLKAVNMPFLGQASLFEVRPEKFPLRTMKK